MKTRKERIRFSANQVAGIVMAQLGVNLNLLSYEWRFGPDGLFEGIEIIGEAAEAEGLKTGSM